MKTGELGERVAAIKHDLAKYVAWRSANLPDEAWSEPMAAELVAALRADILATRTGRGRSEPAWIVWRSFAAELPSPWEPELEAVAEAVATLESFADALQSADRQRLGAAGAEIRAAQMQIRVQLSRLHRRLVQEGD